MQALLFQYERLWLHATARPRTNARHMPRLSRHKVSIPANGRDASIGIVKPSARNLTSSSIWRSAACWKLTRYERACCERIRPTPVAVVRSAPISKNVDYASIVANEEEALQYL